MHESKFEVAIGPMIRRWPTRALVVAGLVAATILLAATVDHQLTRDSLPDVRTFTLEHPASSDPAVAERERLRDGFISGHGSTRWD